jgi:cell division protease FtsH
MSDPRNDNRDPDRDPEKSPFRFPRGSAMLLLVILLGFLVAQVLVPQGDSSSELSYNEFLSLMADSSMHVKSLSIQPGPDGVELHGRRELTAAEKEHATGKTFARRPDSKEFMVRLLGVEDTTLRGWAARRGIVIRVKEHGNDWVGYLIYVAPTLVFVILWIFMLRQGQNGPKGLFSFGKSRARVTGKDVPRVTFDDVAGCDEAKAELVEIIEFLKDPGRFDRLGGKIPRGVLLMGPPGTGKTLLAKAVAGEAKVPFFSMSGASFVEMFVGVGASRVRDLFEQAKRAAPCLIFIDEIDAVGRQRGAGLGGGHDEREQTLNQLLIEMDGFSGNDGVIIVAATNRPDILDQALLRPGRFDRRVVVSRPDIKGRLEVLKVHTGTKIPLAKDVDLELIARGTPGFAGADLANLCNEAALLAARLGREAVTMEDFEKSKDKVFMGPERRSMVMTESDRKTTAIHEAGHAVVAWFTPHSDPVHKVTIIPRGRALGLTWQLPEKDHMNHSSFQLESKIAVSMGGLLAEEIYLGQSTTGAVSDIQHATELARSMVCEYGMSRMGPVRFGENEDQVFLGRDLGAKRATSEETARAIDAEIHRLIADNLARARTCIEEHKKEMDLLVAALLDYESVETTDIRELFESGAIARPTPAQVLAQSKQESEKGSA